MRTRVDLNRLQLNDFLGISPTMDAFINSVLNNESSHANILFAPAGSAKLELCKLLINKLVYNKESIEDYINTLYISPSSIKSFFGDSKEKQSIGIGAVREMIEPFISTNSLDMGKKFVILNRAELLTEQAQNALLKSVEEPNDGISFFILCSDLSKIIPTLKSRCNKISINPWSFRHVLDYLSNFDISQEDSSKAASLSNGYIKTAVHLANNPDLLNYTSEYIQSFLNITSHYDIIKFSNDHAKDGPKEIESMLSTLELLVHRAIEGIFSFNKDLDIFPLAWQLSIEASNLTSFVNILNHIAKARKLKAANVNWQICLDIMLAGVLEEITTWQQ